MEVVKELYDIERGAPDDYEGPGKHETEFIIGPLANAGLSKMHAAMHTALHHHMGRGHKDRHCCTPNFDPGVRLRSRSLRDSLVYGTRKVRTKGLKVDDSIRMVQMKYRSKKIRDSLVYGTRTKRCRHKQCTAWDHQHEWNVELEKWDVPMSMVKNEKRKTLWFEARKSVLDQERIRRRSIPRNRYGELETDSGLYCGYYLREVVLKPWFQGGHTHDFYKYTRDIRPDDWMWEPDWYDPEPEKIEYHIRKLKELFFWHHRRNLIGEMRYMFDRIAETRRQRRHFQRLKLRLKKKVLLWTELNRNSLWFSPWPEGDPQPELVRRSLMAISKRLSTCAPMWDPMFVDFRTCEFYLNHLDELRPEVWNRFHYKCKLHKHKDLFERRSTLLRLMAAANAPPAEEDKDILPPLCKPVQDLEVYRKQWIKVKQVWAEILAARPPPPPPAVEISEQVEKKRKSVKGKGTVTEDMNLVKDDAIKEPSSNKLGGLSEKKRKEPIEKVPAQGTLKTPDNSVNNQAASKRKSSSPVSSEDTVDAAAEMTCVNPKKKKSVTFAPPPLPAQLTFLKKGEGRQSVSAPSSTELETKETEQEPVQEAKVEYVPFKFPIRKRRIRWSIQGGKVPVLPPPNSRPTLSKESKIAALDVLELDKFELKMEAGKPKVPEKGKPGAKAKAKGTPKTAKKS